MDASAPARTGPLQGIRVLELGSTVAGPFCGRLLADFGAEVIKVEDIGGDTVRTMGKRLGDHSLYAASIFRNKALIAVDLRREEGRDVVLKLAAKSDVVVENFRPGAMERWGLGFQELAAVNPGLIMARISGFGQDGPYSKRPGFGVIGEALSGLRHITGDPDRPPPRVAVSLTDYITGLYAAFGIVMALRVRDLTGKGQVVDAALYECAFSFMEPHIPAFGKLGHVAGRAGSRLPDNTPNNLYPARSGFIHIAAVGDAVFRRLLTAMGRSDLAADPRFSTARERSRNEDALDALIGEWTSARDARELEQQLHAAEVPAARIYTMADVFEDPHYRARAMIVDAPDPDIGPVPMANVVPRLSVTPGSVRHAGRRVGADTRTVLRDIAGLSETQVDSLIRGGAVACTP